MHYDHPCLLAFYVFLDMRFHHHPPDRRPKLAVSSTTPHRSPAFALSFFVKGLIDTSSDSKDVPPDHGNLPYTRARRNIRFKRIPMQPRNGKVAFLTRGTLQLWMEWKTPAQDSEIVQNFNQLFVDIFNLASHNNMLAANNILSWNIWFDAPQVVDQEEWRGHSEKWRKSEETRHRYPIGVQ